MLVALFALAVVSVAMFLAVQSAALLETFVAVLLAVFLAVFLDVLFSDFDVIFGHSFGGLNPDSFCFFRFFCRQGHSVASQDLNSIHIVGEMDLPPQFHSMKAAGWVVPTSGGASAVY